MFILRILGLILFFPIMLIFFALGMRRKDMMNMPAGHPEMEAAFRRARASLDEFRSALTAPTSEMGDFALKVAIPTSGGEPEHIWADNITASGDGFTGKLANDPADLPGLSLGSAVEIGHSMVSDWAFSKGGVFQGHFTTRVLLPRMKSKMRAHVLKTFGWPENIT
jgi:uncharacterized protein YegJ (DUF2314 family)